MAVVFACVIMFFIFFPAFQSFDFLHNLSISTLNNYNKKDILTISAEHLNYEIFNKNNNYQINNKMIPVNYHPGFHPDNTLNYNIRL